MLVYQRVNVGKYTSPMDPMVLHDASVSPRTAASEFRWSLGLWLLCLQSKFRGSFPQIDMGLENIKMELGLKVPRNLVSMDFLENQV